MVYPEDSLYRLLDYDGKVYVLRSGYWLKFEVRQVDATIEVPHGMAYSFSLHDPSGKRLLGFDNAHSVRHAGGPFVARPATADHWHRDHLDQGHPYHFVDADRLLVDFFQAVEDMLRQLRVPFEVESENR